MKKRSFAVILACILTLGIMAFAGCGEVKTETLEENYNKMISTCETYEKGFFERSGEADDKGVYFDGINTLYKIKTYGDTVDDFIKSENASKDSDKSFAEISTLYNSALVYSMKYIDDNIGFVLNSNKNSSKQAEEVIKKLNDSIVDYTSYFPTFVKEKNDFQKYFQKNYTPGEPKQNYEFFLNKFKESFGKLVSKNLNILDNLARSLEEINIFSILSSDNLDPVNEDTFIVKEYVRAKILPIFTRFSVDQINFNFYGTFETETKIRIQNLLKDILAKYDQYKKIFVKKDQDLVVFSKGREIKVVFDLCEKFLTEVNDFYKSAEGLNLSELSNHYENDLSSYLNKNTYAEIYLLKMEQFIGTTLPQFMQKMDSLLYKA